MQKLAAICAVALAITPGSASAETAQPASTEHEQTTPVASPRWGGFHVGLDGGYAWDPNVYTTTLPVLAGFDNQEIDDFGAVYSGITHSGASALSATGVTHPNVSGVFGGGQVGYDRQFGSFLAGVETDIQGANVRGGQSFLGRASTQFTDVGSCSSGCIDTVTSLVQNEKSINWIGTVRGRFGYLATPTLLVYATGGLAYGGVTADSTISQNWTGHTVLIAPGSDGHFSDTRVGWTIGGGLEWLFSPSWSAKVEYLYYDLGTVRFGSSPLVNTSPTSLFIPGFPNASNVLATTTRTGFFGNMFRVGLNYHF